MRILIICTYFPPDSSIASVRPYMLSKYLTQMGHEVTVLRSGELDHKPDPNYRCLDDGFKVISFQGKNSDAERYERGEDIVRIPATYKFSTLPPHVRKVLSAGKSIVSSPVDFAREILETRRNYTLQKRAIDKLSNKRFDIVFSTYSDLENIFAGEYAARKTHAKWIMDFRDPIVRYSDVYKKWAWNLYAGPVQKKALQKADLYTCVSDGLKNSLLKDVPTARIVTLYNGYEADGEELRTDQEITAERKLSFCYTGQFYDMSVSALESFAHGLQSLCHSKRIDKRNLRFIYAGNNSKIVEQVFKNYDLSEILDDHGMVSRSDAAMLQKQADIFIVLSWNTKASQGVLTGKFYEGIRANKPILSIVAGDLPNSELLTLNHKYHYGFCYEACQQNNMYNAFLDYLDEMYRQKISNGKIDFSLNTEIKEAFQYNAIAKKLERLCLSILE